MTSMGERVCGGRRPGRHLGRMAGDEGEADAAVVQEDAGGGLDEVEPKSSALDCVSETPRPSASSAHRCVVSPSPMRATSGAGVPPPGATSGGAIGARIDAAAAAARRSGCEQRVAVGAVEEHRRAVVAHGAPRLDEEMGPLGIVGIGPEPGRLGHRGAGQRQVALRRGRHRPQVVAPGRACSGVHHDAGLAAKSAGAKWPRPSSTRPRPNSPW